MYTTETIKLFMATLLDISNQFLVTLLPTKMFAMLFWHLAIAGTHYQKLVSVCGISNHISVYVLRVKFITGDYSSNDVYVTFIVS